MANGSFIRSSFPNCQQIRNRAGPKLYIEAGRGAGRIDLALRRWDWSGRKSFDCRVLRCWTREILNAEARRRRGHRKCGNLVKVATAAGSRAARITARAARRGSRCAWAAALRGNGEGRELRSQFLALALRTLRFLLAIDQRLEGVVTFLANVLENRHKTSIPLRPENTLNII